MSMASGRKNMAHIRRAVLDAALEGRETANLEFPIFAKDGTAESNNTDGEGDVGCS